ncbi:MAG TPA: iron ABC transporter permease [Pyrinomonadaceae bacterium]|nr:iron ABC transporter permease [Chloracidobacterium sp.]MBP9934951.1 iron ABC transporter permease [Pyrinomonadaceae bacterium]MBK7803378.1 iron ABC transporter permease [Chloracidobacterium sp.]MBK9438628.1 iron ABC transporter permease [Chloracidobacterium sp.]MBL0241153.1 iron ABC transporter permease [Chloracidobacterium sp.]
MKRHLKIAVLLAIALVAVLILAAMLGAERLPLFSLNEQQMSILYDIRLPRILLGACVGASLAVAGAGLQSLLRNPLAEPYLLGVSNGAALGTMVAFVFFQSLELTRPILAFAGAGIATIAVYRMAKSRTGMNVERLVLSGVIITTFLSSVIVMLTTLLDAAKLRSFTFWLLGDLSQATPNGVYISLGAAIIGTVVLMTQAKALNLMMVGERDAFDFGVEVGRVRMLVFGASSLVVGAAVAASGSVGYVGLIVPHLVRLTIGSDNRLVVPFSAVVGAIFVVFADTIARTAIAPRELPVGAITALIGAPLFIYLLRKN